MRFSLFGTLCVGLALMVGTAAAGTASIEFENPGKAVMKVDADIEGEDASDMRQYMDTPSMGGFGPEPGGNGDGTVQQGEVDSFENWIKGFFDESEANDSAPTGGLTVDGKPPEDFALKTLDISGATGAVTSTDKITMRLEFETSFDVEPGARHTLRIEADEEGEDDGDANPAGDYEITEATLRAPDGYIIESAEGLPAGASLSSDKKSITYDGLPEAQNQDTVIVFAKGGGGGSPGVGFLVGAVVMLGIALVLARRE